MYITGLVITTSLLLNVAIGRLCVLYITAVLEGVLACIAYGLCDKRVESGTALVVSRLAATPSSCLLYIFTTDESTDAMEEFESWSCNTNFWPNAAFIDTTKS